MSLLVRDTGQPVRPSLGELATAGEPAVTAEDVNLQSRILYLRSYLLMRTIIGFTGIAMPVVLIAGDKLLDPGSTALRGSLSMYYYSGMRDFFVSGMSAAAGFLITYKVFERSLSNLLSFVAGLAGLAVAFFPTSRPSGVTTPLTPLQARLGEDVVSRVHYTSAGVFIVSLAVISFIFGVQEGRRSQQRAGTRARLSPTFWRWFHWTCSAAIVLAVAFMAWSAQTRTMTTYSLLVGESVASAFFGVSWLAKGLELDVLLGPRRARRRMERQVAAQTP